MSKEQINIRVTDERKENWTEAAELGGYGSLSQMVRSVMDSETHDIEEQITIRVSEDRKDDWIEAVESFEYDSLTQLIRSSVDKEVHRVTEQHRRGRRVKENPVPDRVIHNEELFSLVDKLGATVATTQEEIRENRELIWNLRETVEAMDDEGE